MNVYVFVQARLGSTRLPRKVLMDIEGKTMLERCMERAQLIGPPVVLLIPEADEELGRYAIEHDWIYHTGSEEDVLSRFADAAVAFKADHVIRVTADCPFLDVEAARLTLAEHLHGGYDFTTYHEAEGRGVQVFKAEALIAAHEYAPSSLRYRHSPDLMFFTAWGDRNTHSIRMSVDNAEDLETARRRAAWLT